MASEIEALPDQAGFVKFASSAAWNWGKFAYYDVVPRATGECSGGASWTAVLCNPFSESP